MIGIIGKPLLAYTKTKLAKYKMLQHISSCIVKN